MISLEDYFGAKPHSPDQAVAAQAMLARVNACVSDAYSGYAWPIDPDTGTCISGSKGGAGDGGFRLPNSTTGAPHSAHKTAHAVDVFDPDGFLDNKLTDEILEQFDLYREAPGSTPSWCHLQSIPPGSGHRTFNP